MLQLTIYKILTIESILTTVEHFEDVSAAHYIIKCVFTEKYNKTDSIQSVHKTGPINSQIDLKMNVLSMS